MCLRLPWQRHASSALVAHTAGGPRIAVHVQLHFFDNLLNDFITGDGRYSLLHIIQGLQKIRQFLADGVLQLNGQLSVPSLGRGVPLLECAWSQIFG